ncbi:anticodon-binding aminoacyl-tRNA synthetase, class 1a [Tanacetum coccineum]|uniref:Anticodon-binding aminoacyl-tRNA synthetase, class 1a n=1 Tax=Tanacetum coccineum TaxID=301880 RepID=A0ABQ4WWX3_9ASTR
MAISSSSSSLYLLIVREIKINNLTLELEKVVKERDELKLKIEKWEGSSKNLTKIINRNPLTPRVDISFAGLDEYAIRNKIIESKTTKTNKTIDDEDDECADKTVSSVKPNATQAIRSQADKSGQTSQKQGIGFKKVHKIKACFVCKSTGHLIKDCDFYDQKSLEPRVKNVVNTGKRVVTPVWDYGKRVNHQNFSKNLTYPYPKRTFNPSAVLTRAGLVNTVRSNVSIARSISTIRPGPNSTARPLASKIAQSNSVIRPNHPRLEMKDPKASKLTNPIGKLENVYEKDKWQSKDLVTGSLQLVDFGCSSHMTGNKAYLSDYEDLNGGFVAFGSDPKGVKQFWQIATVKTLANGTQQLVASIDSKEYTITEASVRSKLQLADATGIHNLSDAEIYAGLATLGLKLYRKQALKRKFPESTQIVSESESEEPEDQGRIIQDIDDDPLVSLVRESMKEKSTDFVTPTKASGEAQEEEISPTILEAAKTLSKVASQGVSKEKSTDKGKRYRRRARSVAKNINIGLDAEEEINTGREEINTGIEEVSTGSTKVDSGTASKRGQREGKAPMVEEDIQATHKTKEQMRQEEAGLEEAIKLQAQLDEEVAKQIHLDKMVAKRMAEEEALSEQQKKRKAQVQFEAQFYTEEDWDAIKAKLEANAELTKDVLGKDLPEQDFAKRMAEMVNQRKKHFAEERAKAKRNKPMTQSQLRIYMSNYLKNQGTWKLSQLKKLKFKEIKEEFDKLVQQIDTFVPINLEATKAKLKRYREELQTKTSKKQRFDDKDVPAIGEKVAEVKEEEPVKRTGKRKKQKARKGISVDKNAQGDSETDKEESVEAMNPTPLDTKSNSVVNWKIFQQGERSIYQIMRANGADTVYMSFGAMIKDFTREDLIELYRLVMQKYGTSRPEDAYDRVLWSDLRTMFDPPLNEDAIWSLPLQQKMVSWRYYDKCEVHCLTLEACTIYMLADRKYPLSKDACQVMLKMKLLDGKMNEVCYKLLKMIEKQAGIRK